MRILIVDDTREKVTEVRALLSLNSNSRELVVARCGISAREMLAKAQFDLMILDINLPFRDGDEPDKRGGMNLLTEITMSKRFIKPTHVVALTGFEELRVEFEARFKDGQWAIETYDPSDATWRERLQAKVRWIEQSIANAQQIYGIDLCIMTALSSPELDAIRSLPWHWNEPEMLDSVTFLYHGEYTCEGSTFRVAATSCPRMGMVAASTLAQKLIQQLRPRILAMTGICAGVRNECELGDVIVASPSWDWQMGKYVIEAMQAAPDQIALSQQISQRMSLLEKDRNFFIGVSEDYKFEKPNHIPQLRTGPLASGSTVLADEATIQIIKAQHRKVLGVDMEIYGMYSAARDSVAPKPEVLALKSVCDFADSLKNDHYQKYASYMSAQTLKKFVETYSCQLLKQPLMDCFDL